MGLPRKTVLLDMDDVLVDLVGGVASALGGTAGVDMSDARAVQEASRIPEIMRVLTAPGFIRDLAPLPGAVEAVARMQELGWDLAVVSHLPKGNRTAAQEKRESLAQHFGEELAGSTVFTGHKFRVHGDVLIEDKPHVAEGRPHSWSLIIHDRPHNQGAPGPRLSWTSPDWENIIMHSLESN